MTTFLAISLFAAWWFVGMVSCRLIYRRMPSGSGTAKYELGPFLVVPLSLFSLTGPLPLVILLSELTTDRIEEGQARKQVRNEMKAERNRLRVVYYEKLLTEEGITADKWGDQFDLDTPIE